MNDFDFTFKGFLRLLNKQGCNSKGRLKKSFENAKISELQTFKRSIQEEIILRKAKEENGCKK